MKSPVLILTLMTCWSPCLAQVAQTHPEFSQTNESSSTSSGTSSRSVTTTSDGKTTVKTTVTIVNGVKKVVTETTDEFGRTTTKVTGGQETTQPQNLKPWIGLRVEEVSKVLRNQLDLADNEGLVVEMVAKDSPSQRAKIKVGDLLLALGEAPVSSPKQLADELLNYKVGDQTKITIMRKAKRVALDIGLAQSPSKDDKKVPQDLLDDFGKGSIESVDLNVTGGGIESILENPDIPDDFKETIKDMQKRLQEFEKKTR